VVKVVRDRLVPIRRSRGHVPESLPLPFALRRPVLACGAQLKSTFALGRDDLAFVSHHVGDLDDWATYQSYVRGVEHLQRLFEVTPRLVVHDLHPDYASTRYAEAREGVDLVGVQHHHAHIASCLVDNGSAAPVLGVAFDGTGLGSDGTLWGGEVLRADLRGFERVGQLRPVPLPGGEAAVREPWRMALSYLRAAYGDDVPDLPVVGHPHWRAVAGLAGSGLAPLTSSVGRLFDAVAAIVGVRDAVTYEAQAAIELEQLADRDEPGSYLLPLDGTEVDGAALVRSVVEDLGNGVPVAVVSARFHTTLALTVAELCDQVRDGLSTVALSGGVWQNSLLLARTIDALEAKGFRVLTHQRVPCNDGGISLGQLAVAGALDAS
jgi:hydrogenase maturation protein HypF